MRILIATFLLAASAEATLAATCFDANRLGPEALAKWVVQTCADEFQQARDYQKVLKHFQSAEPSIVGDCLNACPSNQGGESCVQIQMKKLVAEFERKNRQYMQQACSDPRWR